MAIAPQIDLGVMPRGALRFFLKNGSAKVFARATDVDFDLWHATFGDSHKDYEYYRLLEETLPRDFTCRYLVLFDDSERAIALQPLLIVDQDLATSINGRVGRAVKVVRSRAPRFLRTRMLMAGCVVGDGKLGVVAGADAQLAGKLLAEALRKFARSEGITLIALKDFPIDSRADLQPLQHAGFTRLDSFPSLHLDLNFESFDQYMSQTLSKVTRKSLRRKFRKTEARTPRIEMEVRSDCADVIDEVYPLYLNVARRSQVAFEVFTKEYFVEAGRRMPERHRFFIWRRAGKAVAFAFCTIWENTIYDNDIGLDYDVAHELNLYYVTFRDLLEWALSQKLKFYASAPFHYDAKFHLRLRPVPLDLYVRHASPVMNTVLKGVAPFFAPAKSDPALRKYFRVHNRA